MEPVRVPRGNGGFDQPKNYDERVKVATACKSILKLELPFLIDTMDGRANDLYLGFPECIFVINKEGKICHIGHGPGSGFDPEEAGKKLNELL